MKRLTILIIFIICSFALAYILYASNHFPSKTNASSPYFAVFLTNGQVYFGHIQKTDSDTLILNDVYYLRANTNLQTLQQNADKKEANIDIALIKLGNEIHGPKDTMIINKTNILFWEQLREDGRVVQAIKRYEP